MNERTVAIGALVVGGVALGTLSLLSHRSNPFVPLIVSQTALPDSPGFPARVQFEIDPSPELRRMGAVNDTWEYRVTDASGRVYLSAKNCDDRVRTLLVPTRYALPVVSPRLEVWTDGGRAASVPLRPMPAPSIAAMAAQPDARLRAYHLSAPETAYWSLTSPYDWAGVRFVPQGALRPHEAWSFELLRTPLQNHPYANHAFAAKPWGTNVLRVLYGDDVTAVRVRVTKRVEHEQQGWITVPGLRLVDEGGQTAVIANGTPIPNALGLDVRVVPYTSLYDYRTNPGPDGDYRSPALECRTTPRPGTLKPNERYDGVRVEIDDANVARLNLLGLRVSGTTWDAKGAVRSPVEHRPFSLHLRLTKRWSESIGSFETTIPVEPTSAG